MEGSDQKDANWYRCQFVSRHGLSGADAAGHPRVLGIQEDVVLDTLFDFLSRRLFGPGRLELLRDDLGRTAASGWRDYEVELARRRRQLAGLDRALSTGSVPDLRRALADYNPTELAELFDDFDIEVTYDEPTPTLQLAATLALDPARKRHDRVKGVAAFRHSGGRI